MLRDRNHPSVIIWSVCNEKLCTTKDSASDGAAKKAQFEALDPLGQRVVSANYNGWNGPNTPMDLQGVDYATDSYDAVHTPL